MSSLLPDDFDSELFSFSEEALRDEDAEDRRLDEGKEEVEAGEAARLAGDVGALPTDAGGNILDECLAGDWHGVLWRFSVLECWLQSAELV